MSASPAHVSKAPHHEAAPGAWLPSAAVSVPLTGEDMQPTLPHEDRFLSIALPLWDWDYLQRPAVDRPSEMWIAEWAEWGDNLEGD